MYITMCYMYIHMCIHNIQIQATTQSMYIAVCYIYIYMYINTARCFAL